MPFSHASQAMLTTFQEVDMSGLIKMRKERIFEASKTAGVGSWIHVESRNPCRIPRLADFVPTFFGNTQSATNGTTTDLNIGETTRVW